MNARNTGFTLIEIVVAVGIFAIIASIVFPGLVQFLEMRERIEAKHQEITGLQKTFLFLANDLRYAANRLSKDEYGEIGKTTFSMGDGSLMEFTAMYPDLSLDGLGVPRRLRWVLEGEQLKRVQYPVMDPESETRSFVQSLLDDVADFDIEVSFIEDGRDNTANKWEEQSRLPDMVTVRLEFIDGAEYQRSFTMMGGNNEAAIAAAAASGQPGAGGGSGAGQGTGAGGQQGTGNQSGSGGQQNGNATERNDQDTGGERAEQ